MRSLLLIIFLFAFTTLVKAQSYIYQYVDPCTKNIKFVSVPLNGASIAVTYYGQVGTFSNADFSNGNFMSWLNQTSGANAGKPCDQATTQAVTSTNLIVTNNIISTLTNITSVSMMASSLASNVAGASSMVGGNLGNTVNNGSSGDGSGNGGSSSNKEEKKNNGGNGNSSSGNNNNSNGSSSSNGGNQSGSSTQGGGSSNSSGSVGSTNNQGNGSSNNNGGNTTGSGGNTGSGNTGSGSGSGQGGGNPASGSGGSGSGSGSSTQGGGSSSQPPVGNTGSSGGTGTGGNGNTNGGGTGSSGGTGNNTESGGLTQSNSSGGNGGTTNSVSNAAEATSSGSSSSGGSGGGSSKNGDKNRARTGALIGTGDIVAVRSAEEGEKDQFKFTMSMTKSNTKNTFARGFLGNFTTQINNSNITFYGAWTLPKSKTTIIVANSSMVNPARDFFNTTTLLGSKRFTKLSLMGGLNFTAGAIGETGFQNLSAVGGGFYMFNAGKKITGTLLVLGVYSPFTQFYEGNWWSSGLLVVPFSSWDYSVTKKFKFNISFSGTYELNKNMLNYQVLTGGKVML
jgi:hypothetical protein